MAKKKCSNDSISQLLAEYDSGISVAKLATKYKVHEATIRRYLRQNGRELNKLSHTLYMDNKARIEIKKLLSSELSVEELIVELDQHFYIESRQQLEDEDFKVYHL